MPKKVLPNLPVGTGRIVNGKVVFDKTNPVWEEWESLTPEQRKQLAKAGKVIAGKGQKSK